MLENRMLAPCAMRMPDRIPVRGAARAALAAYMANISPRKTGLVSFGYKLLLADAKKVRRVTS